MIDLSKSVRQAGSRWFPGFATLTVAALAIAAVSLINVGAASADCPYDQRLSRYSHGWGQVPVGQDSLIQAIFNKVATDPERWYGILGCPVSGYGVARDNGSVMFFQHGMILVRHSKKPDPIAVWGAIYQKYREMNYEWSPLGYPLIDETDHLMGGRASMFENGIIAWHPQYGAHELYAPLFLGDESGGASINPAFPITDRFVSPGGRYVTVSREWSWVPHDYWNCPEGSIQQTLLLPWGEQFTCEQQEFNGDWFTNMWIGGTIPVPEPQFGL